MLLTEVKATEIKSNKKQQKSCKTILFWKTLDGSLQRANFLIKTQKIIGQINKLVDHKSIGGLRGKLNKMKRFSLCR